MQQLQEYSEKQKYLNVSPVAIAVLKKDNFWGLMFPMVYKHQNVKFGLRATHVSHLYA